MFHVWHWAECMQEAGAGTGNSFQRNSRVLGRWREAATEGNRTFHDPTNTASFRTHITDMAWDWLMHRSVWMTWCDLNLRMFSIILTSQMIKSLKKTTSPVLSDISIEWLFPETKEVLLSPVGNTFLFPGDSLISYAVVCDTTRYHSNPKSVSAPTAHHNCTSHRTSFSLKMLSERHKSSKWASTFVVTLTNAKLSSG